MNGKNSNVAFSLKELRSRLDISQVELAQHLGVTQKSISAYEVGTKKPGTDVLNRIIAFCNARGQRLLGGTFSLELKARETPLLRPYLDAETLPQGVRWLSDLYGVRHNLHDLGQWVRPEGEAFYKSTVRAFEDAFGQITDTLAAALQGEIERREEGKTVRRDKPEGDEGR